MKHIEWSSLRERTKIQQSWRKSSCPKPKTTIGQFQKMARKPETTISKQFDGVASAVVNAILFEPCAACCPFSRNQLGFRSNEARKMYRKQTTLHRNFVYVSRRWVSRLIKSLMYFLTMRAVSSLDYLCQEKKNCIISRIRSNILSEASVSNTIDYRRNLDRGTNAPPHRINNIRRMVLLWCSTYSSSLANAGLKFPIKGQGDQ